jgi:cytochrome c biogenesis protein CcdA
VALAVLGSLGLGAAGWFRAAIALTLGSAVAIVSVAWLGSLAGRFLTPDRKSRERLGVRFALGAVLRYAFLGAAIYGILKFLPDQIPWVLAGLSTAVAGAIIEEFFELRHEREAKRDVSEVPSMGSGGRTDSAE